MNSTLLTRFLTLSISILCLVPLTNVKGQGSSCSDPINLCKLHPNDGWDAIDPTYTNQLPDFTDTNGDFIEESLGCMVNTIGNSTGGLAENYAWFSFEIDDIPNIVDENLTFQFDGTNPDCGIDLSFCSDIDFLIFGPNPDCDNLGSPIRCSIATNSGGAYPRTGLRNGVFNLDDVPEGEGFLAPLPVTSGEVYLFFIHFSSDELFPFSFEVSADSEAQIDTDDCCEIIPDIIGPTAVCSNSSGITLDASSTFSLNGSDPANLQYNWSVNGGATISPNADEITASLDVTSPGTATITLELIDLTFPNPNDCAETFTFDVNVLDCADPCPCGSGNSCDGAVADSVQVVNDFNANVLSPYCFDLSVASFGGSVQFCYEYTMDTGEAFGFNTLVLDDTGAPCSGLTVEVLDDNTCTPIVTTTDSNTFSVVDEADVSDGSTYSICTNVDFASCNAENVCTYVYPICGSFVVNPPPSPACSVQNLYDLTTVPPDTDPSVSNITYYYDNSGVPGGIVPDLPITIDLFGESFWASAEINGCEVFYFFNIPFVINSDAPDLVNEVICLNDSYTYAGTANTFYNSVQDYDDGITFNPFPLATSSAGLITFYGTVDNGACESLPSEFNIDVLDNPVVDINVTNNAICAGDTMIFNFSNPNSETASIEYNYGGATETIDFDIAFSDTLLNQTADITLTIESVTVGTCTNSSPGLTETITFSPAPVVSSFNYTICDTDSDTANSEDFNLTMANDMGDITMESDVSLSWFTDADAITPVSDEAQFPATNNTDVYVLVENNITGCSEIATVTLTINQCDCIFDEYTVNAGTDISICEGEDITIDDFLASIGQDVIDEGTSVTWSTNGSETLSDDDFFSSGITYTPSQNDYDNGSIEFTLTAEDPDGTGTCEEVTDMVEVTFIALPEITDIVFTCADENNIQLEISLQGGNETDYTVSWNGSTETADQEIIFPITDLGTTTLTITEEISGFSCSIDTLIEANNFLCPSITTQASGLQTVCSGETFDINDSTANVEVDDVNGNDCYQLIWTNDSNTPTALSDSINTADSLIPSDDCKVEVIEFYAWIYCYLDGAFDDGGMVEVQVFPDYEITTDGDNSCFPLAILSGNGTACDTLEVGDVLNNVNCETTNLVYDFDTYDISPDEDGTITISDVAAACLTGSTNGNLTCDCECPTPASISFDDNVLNLCTEADLDMAAWNVSSITTAVSDGAENPINGTWTLTSGNGTLSADETTFTADMSTGTVVLTYTTDDPDGTATLCNAVSEDFTINIIDCVCPEATLSVDTIQICGDYSGVLFNDSGATITVGTNLFDDDGEEVVWYLDNPPTVEYNDGDITADTGAPLDFPAEIYVYGFLRCDLNDDGFDGSSDDSFELIDSVLVLAYADIASLYGGSFEPSDDDGDGTNCSITFDYLPSGSATNVEHSFDGGTTWIDGDTPDFTGATGNGSVTFAIFNPLFDGACQRFEITLPYECFTCPEDFLSFDNPQPSICEGESINLDTISISPSTDITFSYYENDDSADPPIGAELTGSDTEVSPSSSETYWIVGEDLDGCRDTLEVTLSVFTPTPDGTEDYTGCSGDGYSVEVNGTTYDESNPSGTETLTDANGCEYEVVVDLVFNSLTPDGTEDYTGCAGDGYSVEVNGTTYDESNPSGTETLTDANGCEYDVVVDLVFNSLTPDGTEDYTGCSGDGYSVEVNGTTYDESNPSGTETLTDTNGCEYDIVVDLVFNSLTPDETEDYIGCVGDGYSVEVNGTTYDESNPTGTETLTDSNGCEYEVSIELDFQSLPIITITNNQCSGTNYIFDIEISGEVDSDYDLSGSAVTGTNPTSISTDNVGAGTVTGFELPLSTSSADIIATLTDTPNCASISTPINAPTCDCPSITTSAGGTQALCSGATVDLADAESSLDVDDPNGNAGSLVWTNENSDPDNGGTLFDDTESFVNETCATETENIYAWLECQLNNTYISAGTLTIDIYPEQPSANATVASVDVCSEATDVVVIELIAANGSDICDSNSFDANLNESCLIDENVEFAFTWLAADIETLFSADEICYNDEGDSGQVNIYPESLSINIITDGTSCGTPVVEVLAADNSNCFTETGTACASDGDIINFDFSDDITWTPPAACALPADLTPEVTCSGCNCADDVIVDLDNTLTVCSIETIDLSNINAAISGGGVSDGLWSSDGDGTFDDNTFSVGMNYVLGTNDILNGTVELTLTSDTPDVDNFPNCPVGTASIVITINQTPDLSTTDTPETCAGEVFALGSIGVIDNSSLPTPSFSYFNEDFSLDLTGNPNVAIFSTSNFQIVAESADGCRDTLEVTLSVNPIPIVTNINIDECASAVTNFDLDNEAGNISSESVIWFDGDPESGGVPISVTDNVNLNDLNNDLWTQVTNSTTNCDTSFQINMSITPEIDPYFEFPSQACINVATDPQPTVITNSGGTFSVNNGAVINSGTGVLDITSLTEGQDYTIIYSTDNSGCVADSTITVEAINCSDCGNTLDVSASAQFICEGTSTSLIATVNGGTSTYSYSWTDQDNNTVSDTILTNLTNSNLCTLETYTYNVVATCDEDTNSTLSGSVQITVYPNPTTVDYYAYVDTSGTNTCTTSVSIITECTGIVTANTLSQTESAGAGAGNHTYNLSFDFGTNDPDCFIDGAITIPFDCPSGCANALAINASQTHICSEDIIEVNTALGNGYTYSWSSELGAIADTLNVSFQNISLCGIDTIEIYGQAICDTDNTVVLNDTIEVFVYPNPTTVDYYAYVDTSGTNTCATSVSIITECTGIVTANTLSQTESTGAGTGNHTYNLSFDFGANDPDCFIDGAITIPFDCPSGCANALAINTSQTHICSEDIIEVNTALGNGYTYSWSSELGAIADTLNVSFQNISLCGIDTIEIYGQAICDTDNTVVLNDTIEVFVYPNPTTIDYYAYVDTSGTNTCATSVSIITACNGIVSVDQNSQTASSGAGTGNHTYNLSFDFGTDDPDCFIDGSITIPFDCPSGCANALAINASQTHICSEDIIEVNTALGAGYTYSWSSELGAIADTLNVSFQNISLCGIDTIEIYGQAICDTDNTVVLNDTIEVFVYPNPTTIDYYAYVDTSGTNTCATSVSIITACNGIVSVDQNSQTASSGAGTGNHTYNLSFDFGTDDPDCFIDGSITIPFDCPSGCANALAINASQTHICSEEIIEVNTALGNGYTYSWSSELGAIADTLNVSFQNVSLCGIDTIEIYGQAICDTDNTVILNDTIEVFVYPNPTTVDYYAYIDTSGTNTCATSVSIITACNGIVSVDQNSQTASAGAGTGNHTYNLSFDFGTNDPDCFIDGAITIPFDCPSGCANALAINASQTHICSEEIIEVNTALGAGYTYSWSSELGAIADTLNVSFQNTSLCGIDTIEIYGQAICDTDNTVVLNDTIEVFVYPNPTTVDYYAYVDTSGTNTCATSVSIITACNGIVSVDQNSQTASSGAGIGNHTYNLSFDFGADDPDCFIDGAITIPFDCPNDCINGPAAPTVQDSIYCFGQTVVDVQAFGETGADFTWYDTDPTLGGATVIDTDAFWTPTTSGSAPDTVTAFVTQTLGACESGPTLAQVIVNAIPVISFATVDSLSNPTTCSGIDGYVDLSFSNVPDGNYEITYIDEFSIPQSFGIINIVNGEAPTITGLPAGEYNDLSISVGNCSNSSVFSFVLTDPLQPTLSVLSNDPDECGGLGTLFFTFTNVPDGNYDISHDNGVWSNVLIENDTVSINALSGTYSNIQIDTNNGCISALGVNESLFDPGSPTLSIVDVIDPTSCGGTGTITLLSTGLVIDSTVIVTWDGDARTTTVTNDNTILISQIAIGDVNNIQVTANNCDSALGLDTVIANPDIPELLATWNDPSLCGVDNGSIVLELNPPANEGDSFPVTVFGTPQINTTVTFSGNRGEIIDLAAGIYDSIQLEINNCISVYGDEIALFAPTAPNANAGADTEIQCNESSVVIDAGNSASGNDISYSWINLNTGDISNIDDPTEPTTAVTSAGLYELTVLNQTNNCFEVDTVEVTQITNSMTNVQVVTTNACFGTDDGSISINGVTGGTANYLYDINGNGFTSLTNYADIPSGLYTLTVRDANGCEFSQDITVDEEPTSDFDLGADQVVLPGTEVNITPEIFDTNTQNINWAFNSVSELDCLTCDTVSATINSPTTFIATMTDENGCTITDNISFSVDRRYDVAVPNAFSPNGDNVNDVFYIGENINIEVVVELHIYNRFGQRVYSEKNIPAGNPIFGWDGFFNDNLQELGVYVYWGTIRFNDGYELPIKGNLTLIR